MKSVIMIAYNFPPEGNAGTYRPLRFVRHLPSIGWQPTVITLETDFYERYDPKLLTLVPPEATVIRVRNPDPWKAFQQWRNKHIQRKLSQSSANKVRKIRTAHQASFRSSIRELVQTAQAWCYHPDTDMGWIRPAVNATLKRCAQERPDVIWATAGPVSSFIVAQRVARHTGLSYVLDFRDSWTIAYNDFEESRPMWARQLDRRTMYQLLEGAQAIIFRYDTEAESFWRVYQGALQASRIHIIPNGYDGLVEEFMAFGGDRCKILYSGTLSDYRYDTLLQALYFLKQDTPNLANRLLLQFVGEGTEMLANEARALGLDGLVNTMAPTSQHEITRLSKEAHALLILGRPPTMKGYELIAGAKLFGYLKAGRPIVGVLPPDETKKVLLQVGASTVADANSVSEIIAVLRRILEAWSDGTLSSLLPDRQACATYSAERQTQALVRALEAAPAATPFVPGSVDVPESLKEELGYRTQRTSGLEFSTHWE
jgi:hypothetical protein